MDINLNTISISSVAYSTTVKDRRFFEEVILTKGTKSYAKIKSVEDDYNVGNKIITNEGQRRLSGGTSLSNRTEETIWEENKKYPDTSSRYRRPYKHMGLWSRISRASNGSLPKRVVNLTVDEIEQGDRTTIKSYTTPSRSIRKCNLTVFVACSKMAIRSFGIVKDLEKRTYSRKSIGLSVRELSRNTSAGADTLTKKNNPNTVKRVISQVRDIFYNPTSRKIFYLNPTLTYNTSKLRRMFELPELIAHRFQTVYKKEEDVCKEKSRIVWITPYTIVSIENCFFGNILDSVKEKMLNSFESIYPIGLTNYQIGQKSVKTLRDKFYIVTSKRNKIYSLDFEKFDSSIPNWAKDIFFATLRPLMSLTENESTVYDFLRMYVKYTPFVYEDKTLYKQKGISSGMFITNLFDSWWNLTIHYFVDVIIEHYPNIKDDIFNDKFEFDHNKLDPSVFKYDFVYQDPALRVMGDDTIILCNEEKLLLHKRICLLLGMKVSVKHVTNNPDSDIFFLGRYWNIRNRPYQTEEYMALRICITKWYDVKEIPFSLDKLHLNRILSICLPLENGKDFIDKYLYDYPPYVEFSKTKEGFCYMKEFIEDNFQYKSYNEAFNVDSY